MSRVTKPSFRQAQSQSRCPLKSMANREKVGFGHIAQTGLAQHGGGVDGQAEVPSLGVLGCLVEDGNCMEFGQRRQKRRGKVAAVAAGIAAAAEAAVDAIVMVVYLPVVVIAAAEAHYCPCTTNRPNRRFPRQPGGHCCCTALLEP